MKYSIKGTSKTVNLDGRDFIAKGGEGSIYGKGSTAYKIYENPKRMIPSAKIDELAVLDHPNIVRPQEVLTDGFQAVGYTMKLLKNTMPLVSLFAKSFKQRNNIDFNSTLNLVKELQDLIKFIHSKRVLVVDLNELNFLTDNNYKTIFGIDVNSYQTLNFPATVIMDSVRDRHCQNKFSENTDWFSFGILAFQMLIGIHPFRGNWTEEEIAKDKQLDHRMTNNISVFRAGVRIPKICEPFDALPGAFRAWLFDAFEKGTRTTPPFDYEAIQPIVTDTRHICGTDLFDIKSVHEIDEEITHVYSQDYLLIAGKEHLYYKGQKFKIPFQPFKVLFDTKSSRPYLLRLNKGGIECFDLLATTYLPILAVESEHIMECNNRIFTTSGLVLLEILINDYGSKSKLLTRVAGAILDVPGATQVFDGFLLQNVLGNYNATFFIKLESYQIKLPDLSGYKIIDAAFRNQVLVVVGFQKGRYDRIVIRLSSDFKSFDVRKTENIEFNGINFATNSKGVTISMTEDEKLEGFPNIVNGPIKVMHDPHLDSTMRLFAYNHQMMFFQQNKIYSISLRK